MNIYNSKPKGIRRRGAPKLTPNERKVYIHVSMTNEVLNALDGMGDNRSALIETAVKSYYKIGDL